MSERFVDSVVADVHATRAAMLETAGGEIVALMRLVADHQRRSHHRIIREPLRNRPEPTDPREAAARSGVRTGSLTPPA